MITISDIDYDENADSIVSDPHRPLPDGMWSILADASAILRHKLYSNGEFMKLYGDKPRVQVQDAPAIAPDGWWRGHAGGLIPHACFSGYGVDTFVAIHGTQMECYRDACGPREWVDIPSGSLCRVIRRGDAENTTIVEVVT